MELGARLLTKTKPNSFSSTAIKILVTYIKHKKWKLATFLLFFSMSSFSQPAIATPISIKRIERLCPSDNSRMHYPLDNTWLNISTKIFVDLS